MSLFHRGTHEMEMIREEHGHTGDQDEGIPGKKVIDVGTRLTTKITTDGSIVYIGSALPGTPQATNKWQAKKIDQTDPNNITITWADGGKFSQVATDLTSLTYA